jgi:hypothetical protein
MSEEEQTELLLNRESYSRFLRAGGRPELEWFLSLDESDQEACAEIGDEYQSDLIVTQALAIHDPTAAALSTGSEEVEETILGRMGATLLSREAEKGSPDPSLVFRGPGTHVQGTPEHRPRGGKRDPLAGTRSPTMGGRARRRAERVRQEREEFGQAASFLGKKADPAEVEE